MRGAFLRDRFLYVVTGDRRMRVYDIGRGDPRALCTVRIGMDGGKVFVANNGEAFVCGSAVNTDGETMHLVRQFSSDSGCAKASFLCGCCGFVAFVLFFQLSG